MKIKRMIAATLVFTMFAICAQAQPGSTTTTSGDPFGDEPVDVPVDGGIALLAIAGAAYGFKRLKNK
jgi:hypothetical protein